MGLCWWWQFADGWLCQRCAVCSMIIIIMVIDIFASEKYDKRKHTVSKQTLASQATSTTTYTNNERIKGRKKERQMKQWRYNDNDVTMTQDHRRRSRFDNVQNVYWRQQTNKQKQTWHLRKGEGTRRCFMFCFIIHVICCCILIHWHILIHRVTNIPRRIRALWQLQQTSLAPPHKHTHTYDKVKPTQVNKTTEEKKSMALKKMNKI